MFIIDKYKIDNIDNIIYHKEIYNKLFNNNNNISEKFKNLPNLLFYGPSNSGKKTLINLLIKKIFNLDKLILKQTIYNIYGYGNNKIEVSLKHSNHHIVIEPFGTGFDKYLIQEVIKHYVKNKYIDLNGKKIYKIIFINNVDKLSYYAQTSLRCSMEKYSNYCKFILCSYNILKMINPIKSRCMFIKIPRPNISELNLFINFIIKNEKIKITDIEKKKILYNYDNNPKIIIWKLNYLYYNINNDLYFIKIIKEFINIINCNNIINNIKIIREKLYLLFVTNIDFKLFLQKFFKIFYLLIDDSNILFEIIKIFSIVDLNLFLGKRIVIHFENLIFNIIYIINKYNYKICIDNIDLL